MKLNASESPNEIIVEVELVDEEDLSGDDDEFATIELEPVTEFDIQR